MGMTSLRSVTETRWFSRMTSYATSSGLFRNTRVSGTHRNEISSRITSLIQILCTTTTCLSSKFCSKLLMEPLMQEKFAQGSDAKVSTSMLKHRHTYLTYFSSFNLKITFSKEQTFFILSCCGLLYEKTSFRKNLPSSFTEKTYTPRSESYPHSESTTPTS